MARGEIEIDISGLVNNSDPSIRLLAQAVVEMQNNRKGTALRSLAADGRQTSGDSTNKQDLGVVTNPLGTIFAEGFQFGVNSIGDGASNTIDIASLVEVSSFYNCDNRPSTYTRWLFSPCISSTAAVYARQTTWLGAQTGLGSSARNIVLLDTRISDWADITNPDSGLPALAANSPIGVATVLTGLVKNNPFPAASAISGINKTQQRIITRDYSYTFVRAASNGDTISGSTTGSTTETEQRRVSNTVYAIQPLLASRPNQSILRLPTT